MAIQLVKDVERLTTHLQATDMDGEPFGEKYEFYYRRMPRDLQARMARKHTKKGVFDAAGFAIDVLQWGCLGWKDGVMVDENNRSVPYSPDLVPAIPAGFSDNLFVLVVGQREDDDDPLPLSPSTGELS